ncbi:hypothetical protein AYO22_02656 [Fonsecaea multimorphosa]|nr:hypothetical protein AYO22_02656 [Fonsecaea multimorphosa]
MTYQSPPRNSDMANQNKDAIIEVSDDGSDTDLSPQYTPSRQSLRRLPLRRALSTSSASDAEVSDTEFALESRHVRPPRALKRTRTPGSSIASSPQIPPGERGKRRANSRSPRAQVSTGGKEAGSSSQLLHHIFRRDGIAPERATAVPRPNNPTRRYGTPEKTKAAEQPPYYVDGRLDIKMYRGPGYERFPVVLGTVEGHQELCDDWDAKQLRKLERKAHKLRQAIRTPYIIHGSDSDSSDDGSEDEGKTAFEKECLARVIDVFPDIEHAYVEKKIQDAPPQPRYFDEDYQEIITTGVPPLAEQIITEILEMQSYPKQPPANSMALGKGAADDGTGINITWNRNLPKDKVYTKDAIILLGKHFVNVPTDHIIKVVEEKKSIFDSYVTIQGEEDRYYSVEPRPYTRRPSATTALERQYMLSADDRRIPAEYANRVNELQAAKQFCARQAIKEEVKKAKEEAEALNLAEHIRTGAIMECQCCFDTETPLNRIVPCMADIPHFFCFTCVEGLADNQVGMLKYEMYCMDAGGCTAELSHEDVGRAVPITTFDRLQLNKQQAEIKAANIEGLEQCPCCEYKAICEDVVKQPIFHCQNPECARATCRKCKKESHIPKTCEENNRDKTLSALHSVEEARSEAIIRTCPNLTCKAPIVKDFGCNKMTCALCQCLMCYVCNADITHLRGNAYSHFGSKCILYDGEGINRHENEANEAEQGAITKAKAMDAELDESKLRVDTGKPKERPSALLMHPAADVFLRGLNNRAARLNNRQAHLRDLQARVDRLQALRPDPELEEILAAVHRIGGAGQPPPNPREHIQELADLYRRARLNLARHQPHLEAQLQQPAPADRYAPVHNQLPAAFNPVVNPPVLLPPAHHRPAPAAGAFGDHDWPGSNRLNGINEGRLLGTRQNFEFNFARAQAAMPDPIGLDAHAGVMRERRRVAQPPLQPNNLRYDPSLGQYEGGAAYASPVAGRNVDARQLHRPAGAAAPAQGMQSQTSPVAAALARIHALGIPRGEARNQSSV